MVDQQDAWYDATEQVLDEIERQMTEISNRISECSDTARREASEEQWRALLARMNQIALAARDASPVLDALKPEPRH
jgi:hypothetical protein